MKKKPKKLPARTGYLFMEGLSEDLKREFKTACARKGVSMRDVIIKRMEDYIQGQ